jgi:hypothetical protein
MSGSLIRPEAAKALADPKRATPDFVEGPPQHPVRLVQLSQRSDAASTALGEPPAASAKVTLRR